MKSQFAEQMIKTQCDKKGRPPASSEHRKAAISKMITDANPSISPDVVDMVSAMLDIDPSKRMTVEGALAHKWMAPFAANADPNEDINANGELGLPISLDDDTKHNVNTYH